jgi:hypothetical protein
MASYKTYRFRDKDPIIDKLRTIIKDEGLDYYTIAEDSGVRVTTLMAWFVGVTRRPQHATVAAICRAIGYELEPRRASSDAKVIQLRKRR